MLRGNGIRSDHTRAVADSLTNRRCKGRHCSTRPATNVSYSTDLGLDDCSKRRTKVYSSLFNTGNCQKYTTPTVTINTAPETAPIPPWGAPSARAIAAPKPAVESIPEAACIARRVSPAVKILP